jgi:hypothetical protein
MPVTDTLLVVAIITFIILIIWSRVENQRIADTISEIKEIIVSLKPAAVE